jgi:hypothetical protein
VEGSVRRASAAEGTVTRAPIGLSQIFTGEALKRGSGEISKRDWGDSPEAGRKPRRIEVVVLDGQIDKRSKRDAYDKPARPADGLTGCC